MYKNQESCVESSTFGARRRGRGRKVINGTEFVWISSYAFCVDEMTQHLDLPGSKYPLL